MKVKVIKIGFDIYFVAIDSSHNHPLSKIEGLDYYIHWGINDERYVLEKSKNGEYPKRPHGKVIASTNKECCMYSIPKDFVENFLNSKENIEFVNLEETDECNLFISSNNEVLPYIDTETNKEEPEIIKEKPNCMKINLTKEEIVSAKFKDTLTTVEGYFKEAEGDYNQSGGSSYSAYAVYNRIKNIKEALLKDIESMAKSIEC